MTTSLNSSIDHIPFDFLPHDEDLLDLPESTLEQAFKLSRNCPTPQSRWQAYLTLLALSGFTEWINDHLENNGLKMPFQIDRALLLPNSTDQPAAITQVQLNGFRLCIIATTGNSDDIIPLPISVVDRPAHIAHFYVTVMINPESAVAAVQSFLRYDQLQQYRQERNLIPIDGCYEIASNCFEPQLEKLLFLATGLNPSAIPLPDRIPTFSLERIRELIIHPVINAATWLQQEVTEQFDQLGESFNTLLNYSDDFELAFVSNDRGSNSNNLRSSDNFSNSLPQTSLADILQNIKQQGCVIPIDVRASYQDLMIDQQAMRLTIVTWLLPESETVNSSDTTKAEWSILLIGQLYNDPIDSVQMTIQQEESVIDRIVLDQLNHEYVIQAFGSFDEIFTISLVNRATELYLPPIGFQPN